MKKILGLSLLIAATTSLGACSMSLPTCYDELNECGRDTAYTEERTAQADGKRKNFAKTDVVPEPAPMPEPAPVAKPAPAPAPVVDDTPVMQSAEPQFNQISK